jgi:hypothetical protein
VTAANLGIALLIAIGFAGWPIIGRYSQASGVWIGTMVMAGTTVVVALLAGAQLRHSTPTPKAVAVLLAASAVNGLGVYLYASKAGDPTIPIGAFVVVVAVLTVVLAPALDWGLHGVLPTARQAGGTLCAALAIYLLAG